VKSADLRGKTRDELEDMLLDRQDNLFFGYKMLMHKEATEEELEEQTKQLEKEISILERKLKSSKH